MDGWGLCRAVSLSFERAAAISHDSEHLARLDSYTADLVRPFGAIRAKPAAAGRGQSYGEMGEQALQAILRPDEAVDLLLLAHSIPDVTPGRATTTYLSHVCPGGPLAFALCDQGTAAAFTALRLAVEYARTGEARRALVLVAEQAELPYTTSPEATCQDPAICLANAPPTQSREGYCQANCGILANLPAGHAIVALLLDRCESVGRVERVMVEPGVAAAQAPARLGLFTSAYNDSKVLSAASPDQPSTGVWTLLAEELAGNPSGTVVVTDHDPQLGYLSAAAIRFS